MKPATLLLLLGLLACQSAPSPSTDEAGDSSGTTASVPFHWDNATVYFLLTDRFNNGDPANDQAFDRKPDGAPLRSFMGGDLKGITRKIEEGYFDKLGVTALWMTPFVEQIHGHTDEGTGKTYAFHGYWARDWTAVDPNFGTEADLADLVATAHEHGIRLLMDAVLNHTGPVTETDSQWPNSWVRTRPKCDFQDYEGTTACTLVENLPDIRTERDEAVDLPPFLVEKWTKEGRLEEEMASLDAFFARTGYPRAPRFYLIKWLTDWVRAYGIDGYRVDTAKHVEEEVWEALKREAQIAFQDWKRQHPEAVLDEQDFFMTAEVYGYGLMGGRLFDFGDKQVDFFAHGFDNLINFGFKAEAKQPAPELFQSYARVLESPEFEGISVLNYVSSHDDGGPFDRERERPFESGTKLLLAPGAAQIYYGDETARSLNAPEAQGDATLRSFMNWEALQGKQAVQGVPIPEILAHWQKLGQFRRAHPAVGAGRHREHQASPYMFSRTFEQGDLRDKVLVVLNDKGDNELEISAFDCFEEGTQLRDAYSGQRTVVEGGKIRLPASQRVVLLEEAE